MAAAKIINVAGTSPTDHNVKVAREVEAAVAAHKFSWGKCRLTIIYGSTTWTDHNNRRCADLMTSDAVNTGNGNHLTRSQQDDLGTFMANYLKTNAARLGTGGVIWNHRVMGFPHGSYTAYRGPYGSWRPYSGSSNPHTDHVHVEVDSSAYKAPAKAAKPVQKKGYINGHKAYTMYVTKNGTVGWAANKVGVKKFTRKKGFKVIGYVVHRSDGRYLRTAYNTDYALDSGTLSHTKPKG